MNSDWEDLLRELNSTGVRYLVVGAHAVGIHGVPRATQDIDIWVEPTTANAGLVVRALARFGAPLIQLGIAERDFCDPDCVVQIGMTIPVIGREDLLANKRASGRDKDRLDVNELDLLG